MAHSGTLTFSAYSRRHADSSASPPSNTQTLSLEPFAASLEPAWQKEFASLSQESNRELRFDSLLVFAQRLAQHGEAQKALWLYDRLAQAGDAGEALRERARGERDSLAGKSGFGANLEQQLDRFATEACDYRVILPMTAATVVGQIARAGLLRQLATSPAFAKLPSWGLGGIATSGAMLAEVPAFVAAQRALGRDSARSWSEDLASSALSLGALKLAGSLSGQAWQRSGLATKFPPNGIATQFNHQISGMFGLAAAHWVEAKAGLAPDEGFSFFKLFAAQLSLSVGGHLGNRLLGQNWNALQQDFMLRSLNSKPTRSQHAELWSLAEARLGAGALTASGASLVAPPKPFAAMTMLDEHNKAAPSGGLGFELRKIPPTVDRPLFDALNAYQWKAPADAKNKVYRDAAEREAEWEEVSQLHQQVQNAGIRLLFAAETPAHQLIAQLGTGKPILELGAEAVFASERWGTIDLRGLAQNNPLHYYPGNVRQAQLFRDLAILLNQPDINGMIKRESWGVDADQIFQINGWNRLPVHWRRFLWLDRHLEIASFQGKDGYDRLAREHFQGDPHRAWTTIRPMFASRREMKRATGWPLMKKNHLDREAALNVQLKLGIESGDLHGEEGYDLFADYFFDGDSSLAWNAARSLLSLEDFLKLGWKRCKFTNVNQQGAIREDFLAGVTAGNYLGEAGYNRFALQHFDGNSAKAWHAAASLMSAEQFASALWPRRKVTFVQNEDELLLHLWEGLESGAALGEKGADAFAKKYFKGNSATARQAASSLLAEKDFERLQWKLKVTRVGDEEHHRNILRHGLNSGDFFGPRGLTLYSELLFSGDAPHAWQVASSVLSDVEFLLLGWDYPDGNENGLPQGSHAAAKRWNFLSDQFPPPLAPEWIERFLLLSAAKPRSLGRRLINLIRQQDIDHLGLKALLNWSESILEDLHEAREPKSSPKSPTVKPQTEAAAPAPSDLETAPAPADIEQLIELKKLADELRRSPENVGLRLLNEVETSFGKAPAIQLLIAWLQAQIKNPVTPRPRTKSSPPAPVSVEPAPVVAMPVEPPPPPQASPVAPPATWVQTEMPILLDLEAYRQVPIAEEVLMKYPELAVGHDTRLEVLAKYQPRYLTSEGKALSQLWQLLLHFSPKSKAGKKAADELRAFIESKLESDHLLPAALEKALQRYHAIRSEVYPQMDPMQIMQVLPELGPVYEKIKSRVFSQVINYYLSRKRLNSDLYHRISQLSKTLLGPSGGQDKAGIWERAPEYLDGLARLYLHNRQTILNSPAIELEAWEVETFQPTRMPEALRSRIEREAPELMLVEPNVVNQVQEPRPFLALEHLQESQMKFNQSVLYPAFPELRSIYRDMATPSDWGGASGMLGGSRPHIRKAIVEQDYRDYLKLRKKALGKLVRSEHVGLGRILATLPGYTLPTSADAFIPELSEFRTQFREITPDLLRLLQGQAHREEKELRKPIAEFVFHLKPASLDDAKQVFKDLQALRRQALYFIEEHLPALTQDYRAPAPVDLEALRAEWAKAVEEFPEITGIDHETQQRRWATLTNSLKEVPNLHGPLYELNARDYRGQSISVKFDEADAIKIRQLLQVKRNFSFNEAGGTVHIVAESAQLIPWTPIERVKRRLYFLASWMHPAIAYWGWRNQAGFSPKIKAEIDRKYGIAIAQLALGSDPAWTLQELIGGLVELYRKDRRAMLPPIVPSNAASNGE